VDGGSFTSGGITFQNAGGAAYGALQLPEALQVSSDVFFYQLGARANSSGDGLAIQDWAGRLGFGSPTGVDIPGELGGLVPTPEWRNELYRAGDTDRPWSEGDAVNLSVGQGDLQATPLQLATAYATVANGGTVVEPHLGQRIEDPDGRPIQELEFNGTREVDIEPEHREAIMQGLYQAANSSGGTSADVFAGFPIDVAGKTGTAENTDGTDQSWYAALAPYPEPRYVAVATFEDGGFGAETAAPAVREILATLFEVDEKGATTAGEALD
jgi:penicillin-binding protein 2